MRLYLIPITPTRHLVFCKRINVTTTDKPGLIDKATNKAAQIWAGWEKKEKGWQRTIVNYGNHALKRIPYEEWGLKSVPPVSARRKDADLKGKNTVELHFPQSVIPSNKVQPLLYKMATERDALHRKRLTWCCIGMPITAPLGLLPIIPNIPFFYLLYRAWSHWRALAGGDHIEFLLENKLVDLRPSQLLDNIYSPRLTSTPITPEKVNEAPELDPVLLSHDEGHRIAEILEVPELAVEMDRAIWQVNQSRKPEGNDSKTPSNDPEVNKSVPTNTESSLSTTPDSDKEKKP